MRVLRYQPLGILRVVPGVAAVALVLHHGRVEADAGLEGGVTHRPAQPRPRPRQLGQHQGRDTRRSHAHIRGEVAGCGGLGEMRIENIFINDRSPCGHLVCPVRLLGVHVLAPVGCLLAPGGQVVLLHHLLQRPDQPGLVLPLSLQLVLTSKQKIYF